MMKRQIPENVVIPIHTAVVRVAGGPLHYTVENEQAIEASWLRESARNPFLFDGVMYLAASASLGPHGLEAAFQRTRYATLLHWRNDPAQDRPWHIFGVGVIVSSDNCLIAGRMAQRNAVAGRIYFPAGSIDDNDIEDGVVDYDGNMRREVAEETGFDLGLARPDPMTQLVTANRSIALFRRHFFDMTAQDIVARIRSHIAGDPEAELDDVIVVSAPGQMGDATPSYVRAFADWHFSDVDGTKQED